MPEEKVYEPICSAKELKPGRLYRFEIRGEPICVVRLPQGLFAFEDRCPHRGTPLSEGVLDGWKLTCSAHTWEFDIRSGELLRLRAPLCLKMHPVRERENLIEVGK